MKKDLLEESLEFYDEHQAVDIDRLEQIHNMKIKETERGRFKPDWNLLLNGALSIGTVLLVMNYEKENVITTKAWGVASKWIGKGK